MTRARTSLSDAEPIESATADHGVTFGEAARVWARVAALSFGGPAGQIATMHRILVEEKRWIGEARFLHALAPYRNSALRLYAARIKNGLFLRGYCSPSRYRSIESVR